MYQAQYCSQTFSSEESVSYQPPFHRPRPLYSPNTSQNMRFPLPSPLITQEQYLNPFERGLRTTKHHKFDQGRNSLGQKAKGPARKHISPKQYALKKADKLLDQSFGNGKGRNTIDHYQTQRSAKMSFDMTSRKNQPKKQKKAGLKWMNQLGNQKDFKKDSRKRRKQPNNTAFKRYPYGSEENKEMHKRLRRTK